MWLNIYNNNIIIIINIIIINIIIIIKFIIIILSFIIHLLIFIFYLHKYIPIFICNQLQTGRGQTSRSRSLTFRGDDGQDLVEGNEDLLQGFMTFELLVDQLE